MRTLSIDEVSVILDRLEAVLRDEGEVVITRQGIPIARVLPLGGSRPVPSRRALREAMPRLDPPSEVLIREDRQAR